MALIYTGYFARIAVAVAVAVCFAATGPQARAQSCSSTGVSVNFGTLNSTSSTPTDASGTVTFYCSGTANTSVRLCMELGPGSPVASGGQRAFSAGASWLLFDFYTSAAHSQIWGSWGSVASAYTPSPAGLQYDMPLGPFGSSNATFTVYGRVFASQPGVPAGSYYAGGNHFGFRYGYATSAPACPTGANTALAVWNAYATVNNACQVTANPLSFGSVAALGSNVDATTTISAQCTASTAYTLGLSAGSGTGATTTNRYMSSGGNSVLYRLYSNSGRTSIWGDAIGSDTVAGTGSGSAQNYTVYGRIPVQSTPSPGVYSDTIVVTITY